MSEGKCRDMNPDVFFPSDGMGVQAAQEICAQCPVRVPCLEYALENRISHGVWGGASERRRARLLRQKRSAANASGATPAAAALAPTLAG